MINEKIKLRYQILLEKYKRPTIGKKEYAEIYNISVSTIDKYMAGGGINLVPYKKAQVKSNNPDKNPLKNNGRVYWDLLDIAISLEENKIKSI
jgi:hypothetical protein